jgi:hypothetical protein
MTLINYHLSYSYACTKICHKTAADPFHFYEYEDVKGK